MNAMPFSDPWRAAPRSVAWSLLAMTASSGCRFHQPVNPSLSLTRAEAKEILAEMRRQPVKLERPLVVLGGYLDPVGAWWVARDLRQLTGDDDRVLSVQYPFAWSFEACREKVIAAVDARFPSCDPEATVAVDVVGVSMGGLVARYAALPVATGAHPGRRLRVVRLFTLSSPHRGAAWASAIPSVHPVHLDMRTSSEVLRRVDEHLRAAPYEVYPYTQLGDSIVSAANAAPYGASPWWTAPGLNPIPHVGVVLDPRVRADIARRLRGEEPLATEPRAPLPE